MTDHLDEPPGRTAAMTIVALIGVLVLVVAYKIVEYDVVEHAGPPPERPADSPTASDPSEHGKKFASRRPRTWTSVFAPRHAPRLVGKWKSRDFFFVLEFLEGGAAVMDVEADGPICLGIGPLGEERPYPLDLEYLVADDLLLLFNVDRRVAWQYSFEVDPTSLSLTSLYSFKGTVLPFGAPAVYDRIGS